MTRQQWRSRFHVITSQCCITHHMPGIIVVSITAHQWLIQEYKTLLWLDTVSRFVLCIFLYYWFIDRIQQSKMKDTHQNHCISELNLYALPWAPYQIRKIAGRAYAENAGNVLPDVNGNRELAIPSCITACACPLSIKKPKHVVTWY